MPSPWSSEMKLAREMEWSPQARSVAVTLVISGLLQAFQSLVAEPYFEGVTGFRPFDTQFPLSPVAVTIQLGAYGEGAAEAYLVFAVCEILTALSVATLFIVLWRWVFSTFPNKTFDLLRGGGILIAPFAAPICDVVETMGFARLISGVPTSSYESTMELCILMHKLKFIFQDIRLYFTLFFVGVPIVNWLRQTDARS